MMAEKIWLRVAYSNDIPAREGRAVRIGEREIAIFNLGTRFLAVENRCPHRGGPLSDGIVSGTTVVCPLHAWKFSLETGKGVSAASQASCVETYRTRIEDGIVLLEVPISLVNRSTHAARPEAQQVGPWVWSHQVEVIDEL